MSPDTPEDNHKAEHVLGEHTVMYDESMTCYILDTGSDYFILEPSTPNDKIPNIGKIICCPITEQTPSGFLGRVTEVSSNANGLLIKCENVALEEAFSTLKINASINLSSYIKKAVDENGDIIEYKMVESELLDSLSRNPDDITVVLPNSKAAKDESLCISLGIDNKLFQKSDVLAKFQNGDILVDYVLDVNIDVEESKVNRMKFSLETHSGIRGFLNLSNPLNEKNKWCFMDADMEFAAIPIGPMVLKPEIRSRFNLHAEEGVEAHSIVHVTNAENDLISKFEFAIEHSKYELGINKAGEWSNTIRNLADGENNYFKLCQLAIKGKFGFTAEADLDLGLYDSDSNCLYLSTESSITAGSEILFELYDDIEIGSSPSLNFDHSKNANFKFNSLLHSYDNEVNLTSESYPIQILPTFANLSAKKVSDTEIKAKVTITSESILDTAWEAIALFKDKRKKEMKDSRQIVASSSPFYKTMSFFIDSDDNTQYYVAHHVNHNGRRYYGNPIPVKQKVNALYFGDRVYEITGVNWVNQEWGIASLDFILNGLDCSFDILFDAYHYVGSDYRDPIIGIPLGTTYSSSTFCYDNNGVPVGGCGGNGCAIEGRCEGLAIVEWFEDIDGEWECAYEKYETKEHESYVTIQYLPNDIYEIIYDLLLESDSDNDNELKYRHASGYYKGKISCINEI